MLLAEDLLLLLLDDESGTPPWDLSIDTVLGGALLSELALEDSVRQGAQSGFCRTAEVYPNPAAAPEDQVLADGWRLVAEKRRSAATLVPKLGKGLRDRLNERLASAEILRRDNQRILGIFPRTAALIGLLHSVGRAHRVLSTGGAPARVIKSRAKQIADGDWVAKAVRDVIAAQTQAAHTY